MLKDHEVFATEELAAFDDLNSFDLSEINIFRVENKFADKDVDDLRKLKNVKSIPETKDYLCVFLINLKSGKSFLLAIADPIELREDPYLIAYQQL